MLNKYLFTILGAFFVTGLGFMPNQARAVDQMDPSIPYCHGFSTGPCRNASEPISNGGTLPDAYWAAGMKQSQAAMNNGGMLPINYPVMDIDGSITLNRAEDFGYGVSARAAYEAKVRAARGLGPDDYVIAPYPDGPSPILMLIAPAEFDRQMTAYYAHGDKPYVRLGRTGQQQTTNQQATSTQRQGLGGLGFLFGRR